MRKLLTMCSTHHRPELFIRMIESYAKTVRNPESRFVAYVSEDDPHLIAYKSIKLPNKNMSLEIGPYRTMVQVLNYFSCEKYLDYTHYSEVNDDHIFVTEGWDNKMMAAVDSKNGGVSVAYGQTQNMPTATMHGVKFIRYFNYFFPPEYHHTWVDNWLSDIGFTANILTYVEDVLIDHVHWVFQKAHRDEVSVTVENDLDYGKKAYTTWKETNRKEDIRNLELYLSNLKKT